jgi:hypothetical protein
LFYLLSLVRLENLVCLSSGVQVAGVEDLVQRTGDGRTGQMLSGRVIERSCGAMCGLRHAHGDEEYGFLS